MLCKGLSLMGRRGELPAGHPDSHSDAQQHIRSFGPLPWFGKHSPHLKHLSSRFMHRAIKLLTSCIISVVWAALLCLCVLDQIYWFMSYLLLSIAIILFVQKGLPSILTNTFYGNSRNLLSLAMSVTISLSKWILSFGKVIRTCQTCNSSSQFLLFGEKSGASLPLWFMSWPSKNVYVLLGKPHSHYISALLGCGPVDAELFIDMLCVGIF